MAQVKIYGLRTHLEPIREQLSDIIHGCVVEALKFPRNKRAHRFILLDSGDFFYPEGRTEKYTIIEFNLIAGRTIETKKKLMRLLFARISQNLEIAVRDLEFVLLEMPAHNWGFRGLPGDEHQLNYKIDV